MRGISAVSGLGRNEMTDFHIYALPVGGGMLALCPMPDPRDHAVVQAWAPDLVISMVETKELAAGFTVPCARWMQVPVVDYGVPDDDGDWHRAADTALPTLANGGRVLIHCRGGCGRSGMAVLRLMIAAGEAADLALARLRSVRSCAVETDAQMDWAHTT